MVGWIGKRRCGPIGVDIGSQSVKLLQFDSTRAHVHEAARWDLPLEESDTAGPRDDQIVNAICRAREGRAFRGRRAVLCLGAGSLFVQNIRVQQASGDELRQIVHREAAGRLPFGAGEAEIRYLEAADVRQADSIRREVILLACHRPEIDRVISLAERSNLLPVAIDVEPTAMLRCYARQFRRDDDGERRVMFANFGASNTIVVISRGTDAIFVKYVDVGGRHLDEAVADNLKMRVSDAAALRRHNGDRRVDQRDPEVTRSIAESVRPVLDRLANELSLCLRYHSVTFRGQPLAQVTLGGGEASQSLAAWLGERLGLDCELGDPLKIYEQATAPGRTSQWDVAVGLALRETE